MEDQDTPQNDQPETEVENINLADIFGTGFVGGSSLNTAEGVGNMLAEVASFVEDRTRAEIGSTVAPDGTVIPTIRHADGRVEFVPLRTLNEYTDAPLFRRGLAAMTSLDSFIAHVNRFGDEDSAVFANEDRNSPSVTAVLDYHRKDTLSTDEDEGATHQHGDYRHGRHRTEFRFPLSEEWKAWHAGNGVKMSMADFSVFLEDNVLDVAEVETPPESAKRFVEMNGGTKNIADWSKLTALAKSLSIFESGVVTEAVNLSSGEGQLTIGNSHDTEVAGVKTTVPTMFFIAIPIFREGAVYRLPVRLRYRKAGTGVVFWYELWRSDRAFTDAFHEAVERIEKETEAQVFYGSPEA